jgi:hypothetical protein
MHRPSGLFGILVRQYNNPADRILFPETSSSNWNRRAGRIIAMPPRAGTGDLSSLERLTRQDTYHAYIGSSAEIGDLSRFQTPCELMGYLGLVLSESSVRDTVNRGGITERGVSWSKLLGAIGILHVLAARSR